ncbi:hypothetical protein [Archangium sp.]|uniref:hypothetical protein n=1 Tax=Archangium sp. TaxID=1872627 RepID=UPI00286C3C8F|nr:hypothetical protein [Archangium sp.]
MAEDDVSKPVTPETPSTPSVDAAELESIGSQAAYDAFLADAKAIEPGFIEECCADIELTYQSVVRAVENVLGSGAVVIGRLPSVNVVELSMLPRLAQGLAFAALLVEREVQVASYGKMFERAQQLRRKLRKAADALAEARLLPDADVDEVWLRGKHDVLDDCLSLVALLRRNEARIAGRSPVSASELVEAEHFAGKLRVMLGQQGVESDGAAPSALVRAVEIRDRFWTLLQQRYDVLWRCGAWLYGRSVDERVPPLPVRPALIGRVRNVPVKPEAVRPVPEQRRSISAPPSMPAPVSPSSSVPVVRDTARHLNDLQRDMERKARFLVRIGVVPPRS